MIFFLNFDQGLPSTLGGRHWEESRQNCEQSNLERNAYAKRQMKKCEVILQKVEMYKEKKNVEKCKKKSSKEKIWRRIKIKVKILHMARNDPWSDHPKTWFWAYLSSSCINPNLAYITYFESPFGSNAGTWAKEFSSLGK